MQAISICSAEKLLRPISDVLASEAPNSRTHYKVFLPNCSRVSEWRCPVQSTALETWGQEESHAILRSHLEMHSGQSGFLVYYPGTAGAAEIMKK